MNKKYVFFIKLFNLNKSKYIYKNKLTDNYYLFVDSKKNLLDDNTKKYNFIIKYVYPNYFFWYKNTNFFKKISKIILSTSHLIKSKYLKNLIESINLNNNKKKKHNNHKHYNRFINNINTNCNQIYIYNFLKKVNFFLKKKFTFFQYFTKKYIYIKNKYTNSLDKLNYNIRKKTKHLIKKKFKKIQLFVSNIYLKHTNIIKTVKNIYLKLMSIARLWKKNKNFRLKLFLKLLKISLEKNLLFFFYSGFVNNLKKFKPNTRYFSNYNIHNNNKNYTYIKYIYFRNISNSIFFKKNKKSLASKFLKLNRILKNINLIKFNKLNFYLKTILKKKVYNNIYTNKDFNNINMYNSYTYFNSINLKNGLDNKYIYNNIRKLYFYNTDAINNNNFLDKYRKVGSNEDIKIYKNYLFEDYVHLYRYCNYNYIYKYKQNILKKKNNIKKKNELKNKKKIFYNKNNFKKFIFLKLFFKKFSFFKNSLYSKLKYRFIINKILYNQFFNENRKFIYKLFNRMDFLNLMEHSNIIKISEFLNLNFTYISNFINYFNYNLINDEDFYYSETDHLILNMQKGSNIFYHSTDDAIYHTLKSIFKKFKDKNITELNKVFLKYKPNYNIFKKISDNSNNTFIEKKQTRNNLIKLDFVIQNILFDNQKVPNKLFFFNMVDLYKFNYGIYFYNILLNNYNNDIIKNNTTNNDFFIKINFYKNNILNFKKFDLNKLKLNKNNFLKSFCKIANNMHISDHYLNYSYNNYINVKNLYIIKHKYDNYINIESYILNYNQSNYSKKSNYNYVKSSIVFENNYKIYLLNKFRKFFIFNTGIIKKSFLFKSILILDILFFRFKSYNTIIRLNYNIGNALLPLTNLLEILGEFKFLNSFFLPFVFYFNLMLFSKDIICFANYIDYMLKRISMNTQKNFLRVLQYINNNDIIDIFFMYKIKGLFFKISGKIAGFVGDRTKKFYCNYGFTSRSKRLYKYNFFYRNIDTKAGSVGLKIFIAFL